LEVNNGAVNVRGDGVLWTIVHELVEAVRKNVSIEWMVVEWTLDSQGLSKAFKFRKCSVDRNRAIIMLALYPT